MNHETFNSCMEEDHTLFCFWYEFNYGKSKAFNTSYVFCNIDLQQFRMGGKKLLEFVNEFSEVYTGEPVTYIMLLSTHLVVHCKVQNSTFDNFSAFD